MQEILGGFKVETPRAQVDKANHIWRRALLEFLQVDLHKIPCKPGWKTAGNSPRLHQPSSTLVNTPLTMAPNPTPALNPTPPALNPTTPTVNQNK
jgi:hypothetical protein